MSDRVVNVVSWVVVIAAAVSFFEPWLDYCSDLVSLGASWVALGVLFVVAYFFSDKSGVLRGLVYFCENWSRPAGRRMAFFWFFFFALLGGFAFAQGLGLADISGFHRGRLVFDSVKAKKVACPIPRAAP